MTIVFTDDRSDPSLSTPVEAERLADLAAIALTAEGYPGDTEVTLTLIDEAAMAVLNESHMGKSGPTDVLSFPLESLAPGTVPDAVPGGPPLHLGDVFISPAVVADNARLAEVPFADEMALMVVHGLLHLLGYDHVVESEAEQMEQRERDLLAAVGLVRP